MLALGAFGAAAAAFLGQGLPLQAIVAAAVAGVGVYCVHAYRSRNASRQMTPIDAGQPATFECWTDRDAGLARVRYRGASWDARCAEAPVLEPGMTVYVLAAEGNTLRIGTRPPR